MTKTKGCCESPPRPSRGSREPRDRHEQPPARLRIATAPTGTISTARPVAVPAAVHSPAIATVFQQQVGPVQRVVVINILSCAAVVCASSLAPPVALLSAYGVSVTHACASLAPPCRVWAAPLACLCRAALLLLHEKPI